MKVTVLQENLQKALSVCTKFISNKTQLPILNNVLLKVKKGELSITATNLETTVTVFVGASEEEEGEITAPAKTLTEIVSTFLNERVELTLKESQLIVRSGRSETRLATVEASEFPLVSLEEKKKININTNIFLKLNRVLFASSGDESRPLLTGVLFLNKEDSLVVVGTDGYRLSVETLKGEGDLGGKFVIPARVLLEVSRLVSEVKSDTIGVSFDTEKNKVTFFLPQAYLSTRLIEGDFPPYEKIIPTETTTKATFEREEFLKAIKLASVFARESSNVVKFRISDKNIEVSANTPQLGENKTSVSAQTEGDDVEVAMNSRFLLEALSQLDSKEIVFETKGALSPGVFKIPDEPSYLHIIMPVRVQE